MRDERGRLVAIGALRAGRLAPDKVLVSAADSGSAGPAGPRPNGFVDADAAAEADPPPDVDPDPASPDDV
jgi:hypothetical protein